MKTDGAAAIVFGGASGLGCAAVQRLVEDGAEVLIADIDIARAETLAVRVGARAVRTDITDPASVERAVALSGSPRIVVVSAGVVAPARLLSRAEATPLEAFRVPIEVNLLGTINALRVSAAAMRRLEPDEHGERGVCVATASIAAYEGQVGQVAYAASKGGVVGLTLPVARELARYGVRLVTIAPGLFDTPMLSGLPSDAQESLRATLLFPARLGEPAEYADLISHIVTNRMLNGSVVRLDGALRLAPR